MTHKVPTHLIEKHHKAPSQTTTDEAVKLYNDLKTLLGTNYEVFLQGSYKNDTSVRDMNDVDIVAIRKTTYSGVFSPPATEVRGSIHWNQIFTEIENIIQNSTSYRSRLLPRGDKCIKIGGSVKADIIPAVMHQHQDHDPVIVYSFREGTERPNYPRVHYENGVAKHGRTNKMYKPTVRMFKKWALNHFDDPKIAPSFYVECAVHSVPDDKFTGDMVANFILVAGDVAQKLRDNTPIMSVSGHKNILDEWSLQNRNIFRNQLLLSLGLAIKAFHDTTEASASANWNSTFNI